MDLKFNEAWLARYWEDPSTLQSVDPLPILVRSRRVLMSGVSSLVDGGIKANSLGSPLPSLPPEPGGNIADQTAGPPLGGSSSSGNSGGQKGNSYQMLDPNVVIILVVLLFALICAAFLNSVMRCVLRRSHERRTAFPPAAGDMSGEGLDSKTLETLPVFTFKAAEKTKESPADCTICLSDFVENERLRLLPNCNHTFHLDCIDMWLLSHVSCPVCRDAIGDDPNAHSIIMNDDGDESEGAGPHGGTLRSGTSTQLQLSEGVPNLRAELLRDRNSASITLPSEERLGSSRRSLRSALYSVFAPDCTHSGRLSNGASTSYAGPVTVPNTMAPAATRASVS